MGKRLFWFAVGIGLTAVVVLKGRELYEKFTPKGVAGQLESARANASSWLGDFFSTVSEAMAEREVELREATGLDG